MKRGPLAVAVALAVVVAVALAPAAGAFGGRGGRGGGGGRPSGFHPAFKGSPGFKGASPRFNAGGLNRAFPGQDRLGPGFRAFPGLDVFDRGFKHGFKRDFKGQGGFGTFVPWWGWGTTTVWGEPGYGYGYPAPPYAPTNYYYAPTYYPPVYAAPQPYAPGGSVSLAPVPPPSVVAFPGGRYELRGDGVSTPYQWVWVADQPPVPPPPPTAPPAAPQAAPGGPAAPVADAPSARRSQLFRWVDEQGVTHWTNQADAVPEKHRAQARFGPPS